VTGSDFPPPVELPLVLAGPILRRCDAREVWVWIALREECDVRVIVETAVERGAGAGDLLGEGRARAATFGPRLHIALVRVTPKSSSGSPSSASFPTRKVLAYDVEVSPTGGGAGGNLSEVGLIDGPNAVNLSKFKLPTFVLGREYPPRLLHGSCRKLHGEGDDALALAEGLLEADQTRASARPEVLFLTGDQIYADDVAGPLIAHLSKLGCWLMDWDEQIPGLGSPSLMPVGGRGAVSERIGFSSGEASDHLLAFGEFAAMYLVAWNVQCWPASFPPNPFPGPGRLRTKEGSAPEWEAYEKQTRSLAVARDALPKVRRALANLPVYMLFDDHEITDDWFITQEWTERVLGEPGGRRVVANGVAAYFAFQGWGNEPSAFDAEFLAGASEHLLSKGISGTKAYEALVPKHGSWSFAVPTTPPTVFVDTRTTRAFDTPSGPARLLSREGLNSISAARMRGGLPSSSSMIIVSPAPVFGFELLEGIQEFVSARIGPYKFDLEAWRSSPIGFFNFLRAVVGEIGLRKVVFLSGDVHFASTIQARVDLEGRTLAVAQLTSSALKNNSGGVTAVALEELLHPLDGARDERWIWFDKPRSSRLDELDLLVVDPEADSQASAALALEKQQILSALSQPVVVLRDDERVAWKIVEPPDGQETRHYVRPVGDGCIVASNNLGEVRFGVGGNLLRHLLHVPGRRGAIEARVSLDRALLDRE
jgi:hypothetical protein